MTQQKLSLVRLCWRERFHFHHSSVVRAFGSSTAVVWRDCSRWDEWGGRWTQHWSHAVPLRTFKKATCKPDACLNETQTEAESFIQLYEWSLHHLQHRYNQKPIVLYTVQQENEVIVMFSTLAPSEQSCREARDGLPPHKLLEKKKLSPF